MALLVLRASMIKAASSIALVAGLFLAGCGDIGVPEHPDPLDHRPDAKTPLNSEGGGTTEELRLQTNDVKFLPAELKARSGVRTKLTLENVDDVEHDFQIDEIDVDVIDGEAEHDTGHDGGSDLFVHADSGETDSVTFVINEPGTYEFYCTVSGHKEAGMVGTLAVR